MSLPTRKLRDASVTALGYGTMGLSIAYGKAKPDEERLEFLDKLFETGCTFWDTSDRYGDSEDLLGKWFKRSGKRKDIFLASKFGYASHIPGKMVYGGPEYVPQALDSSLQRLGTDYLDLYYIHRVDQDIPIEITMGALKKEVESGRIKRIGISECSEETLRRAHAVHPLSAAQLEYSPITLDIESPKLGLLEACRELGITVIAYSPLGRGVLTGRYKSPDEFEEGDIRKIIPRYSKENWPKVVKLADGLKAIGERHHATAGQVAIAWVLAQGNDIIPIPGSTSVKNLKENLDALKIKLSPGEISEIRKIAEEAGASSMARYPPAMLPLTYANTPPLK